VLGKRGHVGFLMFVWEALCLSTQVVISLSVKTLLNNVVSVLFLLNSVWFLSVKSLARALSCDGSGSPVWTQVSGETPSRPALALQGSDTLWLFVKGLDNKIYCRTYASSGDSWGSWNALPGATIDGPGATVCNNKLYIVVRGSDGNSLWFWDENSWNLISGSTASAPTLTS
jgi:hypothetical protein